MKNFIALIALLLVPLASQARTYAQAKQLEFRVNRSLTPTVASQERVGTKLVRGVMQLKKCLYDFSVLGGAIGSVNLKDEQGQDCKLPKNAIIMEVIIDVLTAGNTSASGTMELTAQSAGDLKAALAAASYSGLVAGIPVGTAATAIKLTADRTVVGTIATGALTAGKWNVHIQYMLGD